MTNRETITALQSFVSELAKPIQVEESIPSPELSKPTLPKPPKPEVHQDSLLWCQPDYILKEVFIYFHDEILDLKSVRLTCRKFARLCSVDHVLSFDNSKHREQTETGKTSIKTAKTDLKGMSRIILDKATPRLKELERFSVWHCKALTQEARYFIYKLPETAANLRYLVIHNVLL